jgi:hypothetical protein
MAVLKTIRQASCYDFAWHSHDTLPGVSNLIFTTGLISFLIQKIECLEKVDHCSIS